MHLDERPEREVPGRCCPGHWQNFFPGIAFRYFAVNIYQKFFVKLSNETLTASAVGKRGGFCSGKKWGRGVLGSSPHRKDHIKNFFEAEKSFIYLEEILCLVISEDENYVLMVSLSFCPFSFFKAARKLRVKLGNSNTLWAFVAYSRVHLPHHLHREKFNDSLINVYFFIYLFINYMHVPDYILLPDILKHNIHRGQSSLLMTEDINPYFKGPSNNFKIVLASLSLD